jgi:hypothetical protein
VVEIVGSLLRLNEASRSMLLSRTYGVIDSRLGPDSPSYALESRKALTLRNAIGR